MSFPRSLAPVVGTIAAMFVLAGTALGTNGTITGISQYFKKHQGKQIWTVAVEPTASPVLTQTRQGQEVKPAPHKIQGIGAGFVPGVLDMNLIDQIETVSNEEAIDTARRLAREEGPGQPQPNGRPALRECKGI